jgi:hypothetical protein
MKTKDPVPELEQILKGTKYFIMPPTKTRGAPSVQVANIRGQHTITFALKRLVPGQTFLGIYPTTANLPDADKLTRGDYALLHSGEIVQIL